MEWVETTAKTVDEAKELALDGLGVDEHDAEFEIVEEPRQGLFGRTRGEARVRARVRPVQPRPKAERRDRRRGRSNTSKAAKGGGSRADGPTDEAATDTEDAAHGIDEAATDTDDSDASTDDQPTRRSSTGGRGKGRSRSSASSTPTPATSGRNQTASRKEKEPTMTEDITVDQQAEMVEEFLSGLVDAFGADATITATKIDDETIEVAAAGDDLGLLVGPKGNTLQAIHDLSRTVVQRQASGHHEGRVRLDVAGYREKRREALEKFTRKLADQVLESGTPQVLEPMSSADRKVVHDTANEIDGVSTTSEGEDPRRRVVLQPDD